MGKEAGGFVDGFLFKNPGPLPTLLTTEQSQQFLRDCGSEVDSRHTYPTKIIGSSCSANCLFFPEALCLGKEMVWTDEKCCPGTSEMC